MSKINYVAQSVEERKQQYLESMAVRADALAKRIPFISPEFLPNFYLCQGLILLGGMSGNGKSTLGANIIAGYLKNDENATVLVISNEENTDSIYDRVSCIMLSLSYTSYFNKTLPEIDRQSVIELSLHLTARIEVVNDSDYDTSDYQVVKAILAHAAENKRGMILLDYFQTITSSSDRPEQESFAILKRLGFHLKKYGKEHAVPVIALAQLNEASEGRTMQSRVQNDKTIYNHAFIAVELCPDFETGETVFKVHKDRFWGHTGKEITMKYNQGRYVLKKEEKF